MARCSKLSVECCSQFDVFVAVLGPQRYQEVDHVTPPAAAGSVLIVVACSEGMTSDVFVTAVRTGGKGHKGVTLMAVERCDEVVTTQIKTTYSTSAGTALVLYEDVEVAESPSDCPLCCELCGAQVPVENVLGKEGDGFRLIMCVALMLWPLCCGPCAVA